MNEKIIFSFQIEIPSQPAQATRFSSMTEVMQQKQQNRSTMSQSILDMEEISLNEEISPLYSIITDTVEQAFGKDKQSHFNQRQLNI